MNRSKSIIIRFSQVSGVTFQHNPPLYIVVHLNDKVGHLGFRRRAGDSLCSEFISNLIRMFRLASAGGSAAIFTWSTVFLDGSSAGTVASLGMMSWKWLAIKAKCLGVSGPPVASCPWLPTSLALNLPCLRPVFQEKM
jgi:hypothetical protein